MYVIGFISFFSKIILKNNNKFCFIFKYINNWSNSFRGYDRDNSGSIDRGELKNALIQSGFNFYVKKTQV
jgi:Ca2+-binding EF-hand superfamily protein